MASDEQQFDRAASKWQTLHDDLVYGVPTEVGSVALISSICTNPDSLRDEAGAFYFRVEATRMAWRFRQEGIAVVTAHNPSPDDIKTIVQDETVATIYTIGHGILSQFQTRKEYVDWFDLAEWSTHLKRGEFVQRHCGALRRTLNVPFGLFVVSDPRQVSAPVAQFFRPLTIKGKENDKIQRIFGSPELPTYHDIKAHFPKNAVSRT